MSTEARAVLAHFQRTGSRAYLLLDPTDTYPPEIAELWRKGYFTPSRTVEGLLRATNKLAA